MKSNSRTNWAKIDAMSDEDIDYTDSPEIPSNIIEMMQPWEFEKKGIFIRLDADIIEFFKKNSKHYQTKINAVLKAYKSAIENKIVHS
jgi:uncharacterized protein (DUF4415 family)